MAVEVKMPRYGATMEEGMIGEWLVSQGQNVSKNQALFTVEIEKLTNEVLSPIDGIVSRILFEAQQTVRCSDVVCVISESSTEVLESVQSKETKEEKTKPKTEKKPVVEKEQYKIGKRIITPKAEALAKELKISYHGLDATGLHGMITRSDIRKAASSQTQAPVAVEEKTEKKMPLKGARKVIAQRMCESLATAAQSSLWMDADVTDLMSCYQKHKESYKSKGIKISVTAVLIRVLAQVLRNHPICRTQIDKEGNLTVLQSINIAVAVDTPNGLMVPVIEDCDQKTTLQIAGQLAMLVDKARVGALTSHDMAAHVMTLSNLGSYGVTYSKPILNLPESVILGTGKISKKPVYVDGGLFAKDILPLSLTFDHRIVDGGPAAAFLQDFCSALLSAKIEAVI